MTRIIIYLVVFISLFSCSAKKLDVMAISSSVISDSITLDIRSTVRYELDTLSNANTQSVDVYPKDNPLYMIYHHSYTNHFSIFDINSGRLISTIKPYRDGPDGVGTGITGAFIHSFDSIFLFSVMKQRIFLIDSAGRLKRKFDILNDTAYGMMGTIWPAFITNGSISLNAYPVMSTSPTSKDFSIITYDFKSDSLKYSMHLPQTYDIGFWGPHHYLRIHVLFNEATNHLVASFPNDHFVYVKGGEGTIAKYFAGGKSIKRLKPISKNTPEAIDDDKIYKHEALQGFYSAIFYDRWNEVYFRFAFNPVSNYQSPFDTESYPSIIILDKTFNKIGEYDLPPDTYGYLSAFVSPQGLHLLNLQEYKKDEDFLHYDIFSIKRNK